MTINDLFRSVSAWFAEDTVAPNVSGIDKPKYDSAVRTSSRFRSTFPNPDEVLKTFAPSEGVALYRRIRRQEPFVGGICSIRIDAAIAQPQLIIAGDEDDETSKKIRDEVEAAWWTIPSEYRENAVRRAMEAMFDGYGIIECYAYQPVTVRIKEEGEEVSTDETGETVTTETVTGREVTLIIPTRIADRDPEHFAFDEDERIFWKERWAIENEPIDPMRVIHVRYGSASPYGRGDMQRAYNDIWELDQIRAYGLDALERQGWPLVRVMIPDSFSKEVYDDMKAHYLAAYRNVIVVPGPVDQIEEKVLGADEGATFVGGDQNERIRLLRDSISIAILGVSFASGSSANGSFAREQVYNEIRFEKTSGPDKDLRDAILNGWIEKVMLVNYPSVDRSLWPQASTDASPTEDLEKWNKAALEWQAKGLKVSKAQILEKNGLEEADSEDDEIRKAGGDVTNLPPGQPQPGQPGQPAIPRNPVADLLGVGNQTPGSLTAFAEDGRILEIRLTDDQRTAAGL